MGYNNESTEYGLRTMNVSSSGVKTTNVIENLVSGFGTDIEYDNGRIYTTNGRVIDPAKGMLLGTFNGGSGEVEPDSSVGRTFFINGNVLTAYDQETFLPLGSIKISGLSGSPMNLIRWGDDGLAFATTGGQVVLINTRLVPEPVTVAILTLGLVGLAHKRRK